MTDPVVEVVIPSQPTLIEVLVPGQPGPAGPSGSTGPAADTYSRNEVDAAIAAALAAANPATHGTATAGQTTFTLGKAMSAGNEPKATVFIGGALQDSSRYTFNGSTTATLSFPMAVGDEWRVLIFS